MNKLIALFILIFIVKDTYTIDTTSYFPTSVGDVFVYNYISNSSSYTIRSYIAKDTILNNHIYYYRINYTNNNQNGWYRVDTNSGSLYRFFQGSGCKLWGNDQLVDSLAMRGGSFDFCGLFTSCSGEQAMNLFGIPTYKLTFSSNFQVSVSRTYTKGFGFYMYAATNGINYVQIILKGCVLNGIVYGDTTHNLTGVIFNETSLQNYILYPNYPNPFNPETNIKFNIPKKSNVKLFISDILSREIAVLVNENLNAGTYETNWDASNYPSGVYFYKLVTNEFSETKKMILIK